MYALSFAAGFVLAIAAAGFAVGSVKRLRRVVRFLTAFADAIEESAPRQARRQAAPIDRRDPLIGSVESDLVSAHMNYGARKNDAITTARATIAENPNAGIVELVTLAARKRVA
jgi:hypothetical protein